jgi:hypothetical protein
MAGAASIYATVAEPAAPTPSREILYVAAHQVNGACAGCSATCSTSPEHAPTGGHDQIF